MSSYTQQLKERDSIAGTPIGPLTNTAVTHYSGTIDMSKFHRAEFFIGVGTLGTNANVNAVLQQSNNANGASNTNIAGAALATAMAQANNWSSIEVRAEQLTARYVQCAVTTNVASSVIVCLPIGTVARNRPATANDDATVNTRVVT